MATKRLTERLLNLNDDQFKAATQHKFLVEAGAGTLSSTLLCKWLVQDKYYQFAYVTFIGRLLSKVDLTPLAFVTKDEDSLLQYRTLQCLTGALVAIRDEIDFYNKTAEKYDLDLKEEAPNNVTKQYVELFEESSASDKPLIWGLTVLWATELCYLKAWSFAKEHRNDAHAIPEKGPVAALHREFIPNWTSENFKGAVDALGEIASSWAIEEKGQDKDCERLWAKTLALESEFWPNT